MEEKKKRGGCLTTFLYVYLIGSIIGFISSLFYNKIAEQITALGGEFATTMPPLDGITFFVNILLAAIMVVSLILILRWKKIGVYGFVASYLISSIISWFIAPDITTIITSLVVNIIVLGIFFILIKNVFKHME